MSLLIAALVDDGKYVLPTANTAQQATQIGQMLGNDMDDIALLLQKPSAAQHVGRENHTALLLELRRPDDQVSVACFILNRHEQDALRAARPLSDERTMPAMVIRRPSRAVRSSAQEIYPALIQLGAKERHWMATKQQTDTPVVFHHLALRQHRYQVDFRLDELRRVTLGPFVCGSK